MIVSILFNMWLSGFLFAISLISLFRNKDKKYAVQLFLISVCFGILGLYFLRSCGA